MERNKILVIVDDDIEFREAVMALFKDSPIDVLGFSTGEEAIEFIDEIVFQPDLIVLDIELKIGGLSGVEVAHHLRHKSGIISPILFLSAEETVGTWVSHIANSRALQKQNSLRRIFKEIMETNSGLGALSKIPAALGSRVANSLTPASGS